MSIPPSTTVSPDFPALHAGLAVLVVHLNEAERWVDRNTKDGFPEAVARWTVARDTRQAMVTAYEHALASCHALVKEDDTQKAIGEAQRALGLPVS